MDTGTGKFAEINADVFKELKQKKFSLGTFKVGKMVGLRGSTFVITDITDDSLILKLLPPAKIGK